MNQPVNRRDFLATAATAVALRTTQRDLSRHLSSADRTRPMPRSTNSLLLAVLLLPASALAQSDAPARPVSTGGVKFVKHRIGNFRSETFGVADFNGDGKLDIV